jgi:hypothetical protein
LSRCASDSRKDQEVDHGEEGDEGKEESRCSKKDDEEICREEVGQEDCGEARSRQGACQEGQGRHISGTQANRQEGGRQGACQEGQGRQISGTQANRQEGDHQGAGQKAGCSGCSPNAGRTSRAEAGSGAAEAGHADRRRAEPVRAAADSRRSAAGPNGTAESRRAAASGSPGFGAEARNAGRAFGSQQHLVDAGSWGWAVGHQRLVTCCRA